MRTKEFDYFLPQSLIAQKPIKPRDHSSLFIFEKKTNKIYHDHFFNLKKYLRNDDVLVLNNSKVFPARLYGYKKTGGKIEILLIKKNKNNIWQAMIGGHSIKENLEIKVKKGNKIITAKVIKNISPSVWQIKFKKINQKLIYQLGQAPTPPYIKRISILKEYQTIYAKKEGSIAAPTAGFHFTQTLINSLKNKGIRFEFITLHVGLGTFMPIKTEKINNHQMQKEKIIINSKIAERLNKFKKQGRRIIAVGTTVVRALESGTQKNKIKPFIGETNIFIKPGYKFKFIDGLITNFHLPKSTNLILVSVFAGRKNIARIYQKAIEKKYRFYSFGDALLII